MFRLLFLLLCLGLAAPAYSATACDSNTEMAGSYPCQNIDLLSYMNIDDLGGDQDSSQWVKVSDMWGWVDDQGTVDPADDREYAIVGRFCSTVFIDITDPESPVYLGHLADHSEFLTGHNLCSKIPSTTQKSSPPAPSAALMLHEEDGSLWRDIKVYDHYALIVSETNIYSSDPRAGLQIFDLHQLRGLAAGDPRVPVSFGRDSYTHYDGFGNSHNIFVNQMTDRAYAVGSDTCSGGPQIIDISDPSNPVQAGCYADDGYTHDIQCVVYSGPDDRYVGHDICFASNGNYGGSNTVVVLDTTDPAHIKQLAKATYPNSAYSHQGWLSSDQRYFFHNDELDEENDPDVTKTRLLVWDMSNLEAPELKTEYLGRTGAIDHNNYVQGHYLYQSNYTAGLNILDIQNPTQPQQAGYFDNYPANDDPNYFGTWSNYPWYPSGVVGISDITQGFFLVKPQFTNIQSSDLAVTLNAVDSEPTVGEPAKYELLLDGNGPDAATGVAVVFRVQGADVTGVDDSHCQVANASAVRCRGFAVAPADTHVFEITVTPSEAGEVAAQAFASAAAVDVTPANNRDSVVTQAKPDDSSTSSGSQGSSSSGSTGSDSSASGSDGGSGGGGSGGVLLLGALLMLVGKRARCIGN